MKMPIFHDSYWYCYANCAAMLLSSIGEEIFPRSIEVLTAVGLGASISNGLAFFGELITPDRGITQALGLLGFGVEEKACDTPENPPFDDLSSLLSGGPIILGPLDMFFLSYNPMRARRPGADHFVLAYAMENGVLRLHDPAGFAHVSIGRDALTQAWRADAIGYRRGWYRCWGRPKRLRTRSADEIYRDAIVTFQRLYSAAEAKSAANGFLTGREAILALARTIDQGAATAAQRGHLVSFALPLGAKRALDYAAFFHGRHDGLHQLKLEQAAQFGGCQSFAAEDDWIEAAARLRELADIEASIKAAILSARA